MVMEKTMTLLNCLLVVLLEIVMFVGMIIRVWELCLVEGIEIVFVRLFRLVWRVVLLFFLIFVTRL